MGQMPAINASALRSREGQQQRVANQIVNNYDQTGKVLVVAASVADESTVDVLFVQTFIEEPVFTFGSALATNQSPTQGSFPTANAFVVRWNTVVDTSNNNATAYIGATIGMVTTGVEGQQLWVHYSFRGRAMAFNAPAQPSNGQSSA